MPLICGEMVAYKELYAIVYTLYDIDISCHLFKPPFDIYMPSLCTYLYWLYISNFVT